jgi:GDPmannose 4,6-dehydratase
MLFLRLRHLKHSFRFLALKVIWLIIHCCVEAMWLILQQETPDDFVIATGITTTIREFVRKAFHLRLLLEILFQGEGVDEIGVVKSFTDLLHILPIGKKVIAVNPKYFRPTEVQLLVRDPTKAQQKLDWRPKYNLEQLIEEMVMAGVRLITN